MYEIITVHALNLHSVICHYLNKAEEKGNEFIEWKIPQTQAIKKMS